MSQPPYQNPPNSFQPSYNVYPPTPPTNETSQGHNPNYFGLHVAQNAQAWPPPTPQWAWVQPHLWEAGQGAWKIGRGPRARVFRVHIYLEVL